jgi:hypothetical protein
METIHYVLIGVILFFLLTSYSSNSDNINNKKTMEAYAPLPKALNFKDNKFINFMQQVNDNILKNIDPKKYGFDTKDDFASALTTVFCWDRETFENDGAKSKLIFKNFHDSIIRAGFNRNNYGLYNDVDSYCYAVLNDLQLNPPEGYSYLSVPGMKGDEIYNSYRDINEDIDVAEDVEEADIEVEEEELDEEEYEDEYEEEE